MDRKNRKKTDIIDLRSDTITLPSQGMREAMAAAEVGDDQFGEDPTVNSLQERLASLLGKEAALWMPTGTMANQTALRTLTRPGDDVVVSKEAHAVWHETGASAANAGIQFTETGGNGTFNLDDFLSAVKPRGHIIYPPTTLVEIENTHNRAGGVIFPQDEIERICAAAFEKRIATYLDGARLWNVAVATGRSLDSLAAPFDLVSVAFSKGLGAPGGSMLAGSREIIGRAIRFRRMLGGAMRQVGIFAAAAHYGLDHNIDRLSDDHGNAKFMAIRLAESRNVILDPEEIQTNILIFKLSGSAPDAPSVVAKAKERGVLIFAFGPRIIRAVTHLDVTREQCQRAAEILVEIIDNTK